MTWYREPYHNSLRRFHIERLSAFHAQTSEIVFSVHGDLPRESRLQLAHVVVVCIVLRNEFDAIAGASSVADEGSNAYRLLRPWQRELNGNLFSHRQFAIDKNSHSPTIQLSPRPRTVGDFVGRWATVRTGISAARRGHRRIDAEEV